MLTQFAVDRAVCALGERGVLAARSVNRIAIVGPGLDFVDKQEGFDFYAPQSLQPFTLADSLLQCGLATRSAISITTIDISPRVNGHLRAAVRRANDRRAVYRLVLPWNAGSVSSEATAYWKRAGAQVGRAFAAPAPRGMPAVLARGVAVSPEIVRRIQPVDASIVSDRLELPDERQFDLVARVERARLLRHVRADAGGGLDRRDAEAGRRPAHQRRGAGDSGSADAVGGQCRRAVLGPARRRRTNGVVREV